MSSGHDELLEEIGGGKAMGEMLGRVRHDRELSRAELARRAGRADAYLANLEAGRIAAPTLLTATTLARACDVSVGLLVASFALRRGEPLPWPREQRLRATAGDNGQGGAPALGATLRRMRIDRNWSQDEVAAKLTSRTSWVGSLERGEIKSPSLLTLVRLGRAFAAIPALQVAYAVRLAQSYAGEIESPPLYRLGRDAWPPAE